MVSLLFSRHVMPRPASIQFFDKWVQQIHCVRWDLLSDWLGHAKSLTKGHTIPLIASSHDRRYQLHTGSIGPVPNSGSNWFLAVAGRAELLDSAGCA